MAIVCNEVIKKYRNHKALKSMSFLIEEDKITGLIGRNGAGKSTLLKIVAGLQKATSGHVQIYGEQPFNNLKVASNLVFIEDTMSFSPIFNLGELFQMAKDFFPHWQDDLARKLLAYANISEKEYHHHLSKGQKSTFNLIYGLATRCKVTLLDEPMNGMDEAIRSDMYRAILKEYIAFPRTIIISSHHLHEIEHLTEDVLLINHGHVTLHAPLEDVKGLLVKLVGNITKIKESIPSAEIYYENESLVNGEVIVEATSIASRETELSQQGISIHPVSASEVCKYLTSQTRGGIDDVFK
ncbi:ATP-binding cassette domain-containing protein [Ureibacillus manganicus]|uniref:ABC transporter domain-containing protein n=1 Tax=Ureibacillus manganicus DSM 26584 TaxID=1384049 RepID=A0A0A3HTC1_9BACL|nr:ABC transporter ATP-binding protein [Ureibacillus manganicus]KGR75684.1 hypothetical protein CD29_17785 [Ureibacillus manganicus DSM 26584]